MPSLRPRDEIAAAVIDAVTSLQMTEDGSVPRTELEATAVRREVFANLALARYLQDHPGLHDLSEGERYNAIDEGLALLSAEAIIWLLGNGHLDETVPGRVRLTDKRIKIGGAAYAPGTNREADLFFSMRRVTPSRVELIRQSIAELGDLREFFPVLVDTEGNVVDGRHRRACDANWPASKALVPAEARIAVATAANRSNAWTKDDWGRLLQHRQHVSGRKKAVRALARLALQEDASRSDREIARLIGCSDKTVATVRDELVTGAEIPHFTHFGGQGNTHGNPGPAPEHKPEPPVKPAATPRPPVLTPEKQAEVSRLVDEGAKRTQVVTETGLKENTAQRAMEIARAAGHGVLKPVSVQSEHAHDMGSWVRMRQCIECGEMEIGNL